MDGFFWSYWYFHLPNYLFAALIYTLLGRFLLGLFVPEDWGNYIWRAFRRLTDPVLAVTGVITPRVIGPRLLVLLSAFWLGILRIGLFVAFYAAGLAPTVAGS